ncbi:hypothetical protein IE81DRAFT_323308 [Ceraceosorus guamensis]|uniref:Uncharacterized protein n=1 Tax=Ceraceosorus guamensis TaxID=1522189 RepID=A0A316W1X2_9BASI|nr:hypothetical protein IE81DRAFT_323308 [Ceraceosorus guamensis]PWN42551.1 hypothetical protein IE81DRAFT_323308 [Ceraceosorus guamensis]
MSIAAQINDTRHVRHVDAGEASQTSTLSAATFMSALSTFEDQEQHAGASDQQVDECAFGAGSDDVQNGTHTPRAPLQHDALVPSASRNGDSAVQGGADPRLQDQIAAEPMRTTPLPSGTSAVTHTAIPTATALASTPAASTSTLLSASHTSRSGSASRGRSRRARAYSSSSLSTLTRRRARSPSLGLGLSSHISRNSSLAPSEELPGYTARGADGLPRYSHSDTIRWEVGPDDGSSGQRREDMEPGHVFALARQAGSRVLQRAAVVAGSRLGLGPRRTSASDQHADSASRSLSTSNPSPSTPSQSRHRPTNVRYVVFVPAQSRNGSCFGANNSSLRVAVPAHRVVYAPLDSRRPTRTNPRSSDQVAGSGIRGEGSASQSGSTSTSRASSVREEAVLNARAAQLVARIKARLRSVRSPAKEEEEADPSSAAMMSAGTPDVVLREHGEARTAPASMHNITPLPTPQMSRSNSRTAENVGRASRRLSSDAAASRSSFRPRSSNSVWGDAAGAAYRARQEAALAQSFQNRRGSRESASRSSNGIVRPTMSNRPATSAGERPRSRKIFTL